MAARIALRKTNASSDRQVLLAGPDGRAALPDARAAADRLALLSGPDARVALAEHSDQRTPLATPKQVAAEVDPQLLSWSAMALDMGAFAVVGFTAETDLACTLRFTIYRGKVSYPTSVSSPDQTEPHSVQTANITNAAHRGQWYDFEWAWWYDGRAQSRILIGTDLIYVPAAGEGMWIGSG